LVESQELAIVEKSVNNTTKVLAVGVQVYDEDREIAVYAGVES
jgi:hypothetical protein